MSAGPPTPISSTASRRRSTGPPCSARASGSVDDALWRLRDDGPRPGELEQAKKRLLLDFYLTRSLGTRAKRLAQYGALAALPQVQRYPDTLRAVTAADVRRAVRSYLAPNNRVVGITGAAHQGEAREPPGDAP